VALGKRNDGRDDGRLMKPTTPNAPVPPAQGNMSTSAKMSLAEIALQLRDEQLKAHVVHYKQELETNAELDAVTAQVIAELQMLQRAAQPPQSTSLPKPEDRAQIEIELIGNLKLMLAKLFRNDKLASIVQRKLGEVSKRFARLFFESELHGKIKGGGNEVKTMRYSEQALYHVISKHEATMRADLEKFEYYNAEVKSDALERLDDYVKELRNGFLSRTTPELNALVRLLNEVLSLFFMQELPPVVGELAWEVVREARLADSKIRGGYKVSAEMFSQFRQAFERRFLQRLVPFAADEMLKRVHAGEGKFRSETLRFVSDPHIFSDVCELVCEASYDFLYNEGFLDLPADWRAKLGTSGAV
jgi:hypothetical protein